MVITKIIMIESIGYMLCSMSCASIVSSFLKKKKETEAY